MSPEERSQALLPSPKAANMPNEREREEQEDRGEVGKHQLFFDVDNFKALNTEYSYGGPTRY